MTDDEKISLEKISNAEAMLNSKEDIERLIDAWGFLPFFANAIQGFSIEEHIHPRYWFGSEPGAWEWKGAIIGDGYVYGKIFNKKCGFATVEWYKHLANWRRDGYDFDSRSDDGLAPHQDQHLYGRLSEIDRIQSKGLKSIAGFDKKGGRKGFDTIITRLQMQCYVCVSDFPYLVDKNGNEYGWGITEYSTPEKLYGADFTTGLYDCKPMESMMVMKEHLHTIIPWAAGEQLEKFIGVNK